MAEKNSKQRNNKLVGLKPKQAESKSNNLSELSDEDKKIVNGIIALLKGKTVSEAQSLVYKAVLRCTIS